MIKGGGKGDIAGYVSIVIIIMAILVWVYYLFTDKAVRYGSIVLFVFIISLSIIFLMLLWALFIYLKKRKDKTQ